MFPTSPRHHQNYTWDYSYIHETLLSHPSPFPHLTSLEHVPLPLSKPPLQIPTDLPSLAHLTAVVKPLETIKPEDLSENQLQDMWEEGLGLGMAMEEFREQMVVVSGILEELLGVRRRGSTKGLKGGRRGRGNGVGLGL